MEPIVSRVFADGERDGVGGVLAKGDGDAFAGHEASVVGELEEVAVLIEHARDAKRLAERGVIERAPFAGRELSGGGGDRIAVRVDAGVAEESVDFVEHLVADGVLEPLGLGGELRSSRA